MNIITKIKYLFTGKHERSVNYPPLTNDPLVLQSWYEEQAKARGIKNIYRRCSICGAVSSAARANVHGFPLYLHSSCDHDASMYDEQWEE